MKYALLIYAIIIQPPPGLKATTEQINTHGPATSYDTERSCLDDAEALMRLAPEWSVKCQPRGK